MGTVTSISTFMVTEFITIYILSPLPVIATSITTLTRWFTELFFLVTEPATINILYLCMVNVTIIFKYMAVFWCFT